MVTGCCVVGMLLGCPPARSVCPPAVEKRVLALEEKSSGVVAKEFRVSEMGMVEGPAKCLWLVPRIPSLVLGGS